MRHAVLRCVVKSITPVGAFPVPYDRWPAKARAALESDLRHFLLITFCLIWGGNCGGMLELKEMVLLINIGY